MPRIGGRQKGTPNKRTLLFKEYFDGIDFSCPEEWLGMYQALKDAPEQLLYMDLRIKVLERITTMIHPKPKEIDMFSHELSQEQSKLNAAKTHELLKEIENRGHVNSNG